MVENFVSLSDFQWGSEILENDNKGKIVEIDKFKNSQSHAIENVYYVQELKHNLLSIFEMCDKQNNVLFTSV